MRTKREENLRLVMSGPEKATLRRLAEHEGGLSQAAVLRRLIRIEGRKHGLWPAAQSEPNEPAKLTR